MDLTALRAQSRRLTKTNENNYSNTDLDADIDRTYKELQQIVNEAEGIKNTGGNFKVIDHEDTTSLTEQDLGYNGEYPKPDGAIDVLEYHIKYEATGEYYKAEIVNKSEIDSEMFNDNDVYSQEHPKVFVFRDSYFIRPLLKDTTVTDGIKLLINDLDTLTGTADEPIFEESFHHLIPLKVAQDYSLIYPEKHSPLIDRKVAELEAQLVSFYQSKTPIELKLKTINEKF